MKNASAARYRPAHLGKRSPGPVATVDRIPWQGKPITVELACDEFTSLCPVTGQPDFGTLTVRAGPQEGLVACNMAPAQARQRKRQQPPHHRRAGQRQVVAQGGEGNCRKNRQQGAPFAPHGHKVLSGGERKDQGNRPRRQPDHGRQAAAVLPGLGAERTLAGAAGLPRARDGGPARRPRRPAQRRRGLLVAGRLGAERRGVLRAARRLREHSAALLRAARPAARR